MSDYHKVNQQRVARIQEAGDILELLAYYGYQVRSEYHTEQQFSCDLHGDGNDGKPSARVYPDTNSWFCVDVEEKVLTSRGWIPLREIDTACKVLSGDGVWDTPIAYFPKGRKEVFLVQTNSGYSVRATSDHEIYSSSRGWVPVSSLLVGESVQITSPQVPCFPSTRELPFSVRDLNERSWVGYPNLTLPEEWSLELGEVMGYVFGDGWVTRREDKGSSLVGVTTKADEKDCAEQVFHRLQAWTSRSGSVTHRTDESVVNGKTYTQDMLVYTVANDGLYEFFSRLGLSKDLPANKRALPNTLWQAPENALRGFLRGVFAADGSVFQPQDRKSVRVNLYSVSDAFLKDVQLVLLQFGIRSRVLPPSKTRKPDGKLSHPAGFLQLATVSDVAKFRSIVGIWHPRKEAKLATHVVRAARSATSQVASVVSLGLREVADISMPREHSFVAGGIRVHNCFACDESRDIVRTYMIKENASFASACYALEKEYGLEHIQYDHEESSAFEPVEYIPTTWEDEQEETLRKIQFYQKDDERRGDHAYFEPMEWFKIWSVYDMVCWRHRSKDWSDEVAMSAMVKVRSKVMDKLKERMCST